MFVHDENMKIFKRAIRTIPGGLFSNFKKQKNSPPVYVKSVDGCRFTDYDGNIYIDFSLSAGPSILGHSNENYKLALINQIQQLYTNEYCLVQIEAAEKIVEHIPAAELVRFTVSGAEAVYNAVRVARGYTGKNMIVKFKGQYNGGMDFILGGMVRDQKNPVAEDGIDSNDFYTKTTYTDGRAEHALDDCYMIEWNDLDEVEKLFKAHSNEIACLIMEPIPLNIHGCMPEPGYLEGVRELCTKYDVVLIFDETLTGFRIGINGAQGYFGVTPDLCILAKAVGGGFPVAVFCGKREIMDVITDTKVLSVGTYNGHPLGAAAILSTIHELEKNNFKAYKNINKLGNMLKDGMLSAAKKHGIPMIVQGFPGALYPIFTTKEKIINHRDAIQNTDLKIQTQFLELIKEKGILHNARMCLSAAHTEEDINYTIKQVDEALSILVGNKI